jgi:hypothetical protein
MHVLIANSEQIAKSVALIDWGWTLQHRHPMTFKNLNQEEVRLVHANRPELLRGWSNGTKLYVIYDHISQRDIDNISVIVSGCRFDVQRDYGEQGKI